MMNERITEAMKITAYNASDVARIFDVSTNYVMKNLKMLPWFATKRGRRVTHLDLVEWMANRPEWHGALERLCGPLPSDWPRGG